ncbi:MAG: ABC transporter ATP-binding protein [Thermomicrobiales bacterium]|nr:ABC transporter ATP-binding protein [Thermomicrobiales bacterium]
MATEPIPESERRPITRSTVRRVVGFFRPYKLRVALTLLAIIVVAVIGLANPYLLKLIIDDAIANRNLEKLYLYVGLMIALPILTGLIGVGQTYLNTVIGQNVMRDLRNALYGHLQRMPMRFFTATRTGEIQARLSSDVSGVQQVVTDTATSIVSNLATSISTVVAMWLISWQMTLISLGMLPIFLFFTYKVGEIRRRVKTETQETIADMTSQVEETLSVSGVLLTKAFGRQSREIDRFHGLNERLTDLQIRQQMVGRWFFMIIGTFFSITPAIVYWYAGVQIIGGNAALTIGDIVAFTTLQSRLFFPLGQMLNVQVEIQVAFALFDRIFEYLDLPVEITDREGAIALDPNRVRGSIAFDHVYFRYPDAAARPGSVALALDGAEVAVVHEEPIHAEAAAEPTPPFGLIDITFGVEPGQLVALVGPSGSGKTTIALLVPRIYDVDSGAVRIDGIDVRDVTLASLGATIGIVTQETYLFHASIRDNIAYGRIDASMAEIEAAARAAAIHDRILEFPEGYDTIVGERGFRLSGGEKQRIAIARVILKDPRILILDEATSALDTRSERLIQAALEPLMQNRTTLAIAHRLSTILAADLILVIDRGRVVERGTHAELLALGGLYARLYRQQFGAGEPEAAPVMAASGGAPGT